MAFRRLGLIHRERSFLTPIEELALPMTNRKRHSSNFLTTVALAILIASAMSMVGIIFITKEEPENETAVTLLEPTAMHPAVGFELANPGDGFLEFRDGRRIQLPGDVQHYDTNMDCEGGCPPLHRGDMKNLRDELRSHFYEQAKSTKPHERR